MAARLRTVAWSLTAVLLSGLLAGCAQQGNPTVAEPLAPEGRATVVVAQAAPVDKDSERAEASAAADGHNQGEGSGAGHTDTSEEQAPTSLGRIDVRLTRETWDRPAPYPARFAAYADFYDAAGREVKTPKDAAWSLMFAGDGMVRAASGRGMPAFAEFEATTPGAYVATFALQAEGFRTARQSITVEAFGERGTDLVYYEGMAGMAPFAFSGAMIANAPGKGMTYVASTGGSWELQEGFGHGGDRSWRSNYDDGTISNLTLPRLWVPTDGAVLDFWSRGGAESNGFDGLYVNAIDSLGNLVQLARFQDDGPNWREHRVHIPGGVQLVQFQFRADAVCGGTPMPVNGEATGACGHGYDSQGFWIDDITVWAK